MKDIKCVFCRELNGHLDTNFAKIYPELRNRCILSSKTFAIMPCIGQLNETHCLIIPKQHTSCFLEFNNAYIDKITGLISRFAYTFKGKGKLLIFEHGVMGPEEGGCGIYHAHLHLIMIHNDIDFKIVHTFDNPQFFDSLDKFLSFEMNNSAKPPYIFIGTPNEGFYFETCSSNLPSQYLRCKISVLIGNSEWDWRKYGKQQSLYNTLKLFDNSNCSII